MIFICLQPSLLQGQEIVVDCTYDSLELKKQLPSKFFVASLDIQADFKVDKDELLYLIDIPTSSYVLMSDLVQTLFYLRKKECFSKIEISYNQDDHFLVFNLDGLFIVSNVRLHGSMIGKEKYRSSYIMEIGECFDEKKHLYSLKKIKEKFYQSGCFKANVYDKIVYDPILKNVKVDLYLYKGPQFSVGDCKFDIVSPGTVAEQDLALIIHQLNRLFIKRFFLLRYTKDLVEKSMTQFKNYLNKKGLSRSTIDCQEVIDHENRQVNLHFTLSFEDKKEFVFWGNHFFTQENFLENILMYGKSSWHFPGAILSDEIQSMYKSKGFWDVQVSVKEEPGKVYCIIHEGKRARLQSVEIKDNVHIPTKQLEVECFSTIQNKLFDRDTFSQALHALKQLYMQHGFWDMKIVKEEFLPCSQSSDQGSVDYKVSLTLDEGEMRKLKSVEIQGYEELLKEKPFVELSDLKKPIPFNYTLLSLQKNWLANYFQDLGHSKVIVSYELVDSDDGITVKWIIHLDEKQVHFGKLVVCGNSKIPFKYLQRELDIKSGQLWNKKSIERSIDNLRGLNLFDTTYIYSHKDADEHGNIPVGVKLIAADVYEVRARTGLQQVGKDFSLQQGVSYKFGGTLIVNNPCKFGDRLVFEGDFTRFYGNLSMQYLMPWLFHRPIRSQIKLYNNSYLQPLYIGSDVSIFSAYQKGILFGLQEKHEKINFGMSVGVEFKGIEEADIDDVGVSIDYNPSFFHKQFAFFFIEPSLMWSNVDNIINPRSGSTALVSCLSMFDIASQTGLFKVLGEYSLYIPCTPRTVFAVRTRCGHVFNRKYNELLPIDRFYLGGANTIRGYDRDYCPPLGLLAKPVQADGVALPEEADGMWRYVSQGGRTMVNCNFEMRFPIYSQFEGAVYFDTGVLVKDSIDDVADNMLGGVGFGLRYNTPIGPLRFDIAFKLDRKYPDFESPYVWYLTLGQAF